MHAIVFSFCLTLLAPIPKNPYEGLIAVSVRYPAEVLILKPDGKILKRLVLKNFQNIYSVKIAKGGQFLLVNKFTETTMFGNTNYWKYSGFLIDLTQYAESENGAPSKFLGKEENHQVIYLDKPSVRWVLNHDGTTIYGSEIDTEKPATNSIDTLPTKYWKYTIKTDKYESIPIPDGYFITGISDDEKVITAYAHKNAIPRSYLISTKDWKPTLISEDVQTIQSISPDSRKALMYFYPDGVHENTKKKLKIYDLKDKTSVIVHVPEINSDFRSIVFGADQKNIAFFGMEIEHENGGDTKTRYRIYVSDLKGSNIKKIYENKVMEYFSIIDWR